MTNEQRDALIRVLEIKRQAQEMLAFRPFLCNPETYRQIGSSLAGEVGGRA